MRLKFNLNLRRYFKILVGRPRLLERPDGPGTLHECQFLALRARNLAILVIFKFD